jgi:hypothetical protein
MNPAVSSPDPAPDRRSTPAIVAPAFVLLFAMTPDAAAERAASFPGLQPMSDEASLAYRNGMDSLQRRLLGESYAQASRLERTAVGRMSLPDRTGELSHADIHLVVHQCGAAVWEVSVFGPPQPLDVARWIGWLDLESQGSPARIIWDTLAAGRQGAARTPEMYLPLAVLRFRDQTPGELVARHARDLVTLLHRDASGGRFKASFVGAELAADLCRGEDGLWLLARNGAIDVNADSHDATASQLPPDTLPLLLSLEVLCLDRAVLRSFLDRFTRGAYGTVDDLIQLRRDIFNDLEEYYGTLAKPHGFTADAIARGERLYGIDDLFEAVMDRMEALTFEITTRNQQAVNRLGLWLTTSFGAIETGFVAASIATWYYAKDLFAVLGWTIGVTFATALAIAGLLRWKMKR